MATLSREDIISLIDPFRQRPELSRRADGELMEILVKLHSNLYEFKHEHYKMQSRSIVNDLMKKERELQIREEEIQIKEKRLRDSEFKLSQNRRENWISSPDHFQTDDDERSSVPVRVTQHATNDHEEYVNRPPDFPKRECLLNTPSCPIIQPRRSQPVITDEYDAELREALRLSEEEEFKARQAAANSAREREEFEEAMAISSKMAFTESIPKNLISNSDVRIDMSNFSGIPADVTEEFLSNVYILLKNQDFVGAKELYTKISGGSCSWLMRLKCGNSALRQKIMSKDPEAYKCIKCD